MSLYYLIAQLPSLDIVTDTTPLPITEDNFLSLCEEYLGKKTVKQLSRLTLSPPRDLKSEGNRLINSWNNNERMLRLALGKIRGEKLNKPFDTGNATIPSHMLKTAETAVKMESPLEAEKYLNRIRMDYLETLRPSDSFCEDAIFYYGLKLKLAMRMKMFDEQKGQKSYKNIYSSILSGDERRLNNE